MVHCTHCLDNDQKCRTFDRQFNQLNVLCQRRWRPVVCWAGRPLIVVSYANGKSSDFRRRRQSYLAALDKLWIGRISHAKIRRKIALTTESRRPERENSLSQHYTRVHGGHYLCAHDRTSNISFKLNAKPNQMHSTGERIVGPRTLIEPKLEKCKRQQNWTPRKSLAKTTTLRDIWRTKQIWAISERITQNWCITLTSICVARHPKQFDFRHNMYHVCNCTRCAVVRLVQRTRKIWARFSHFFSCRCGTLNECRTRRNKHKSSHGKIFSRSLADSGVCVCVCASRLPALSFHTPHMPLIPFPRLFGIFFRCHHSLSCRFYYFAPRLDIFFRCSVFFVVFSLLSLDGSALFCVFDFSHESTFRCARCTADRRQKEKLFTLYFQPWFFQDIVRKRDRLSWTARRETTSFSLFDGWHSTHIRRSCGFIVYSFWFVC